MAEDPKKYRGSITQPADAKEERISEISNINRTISNMQRQIEQNLSDTEKYVGESKSISTVQNSLTKVLQKLSHTVGDIGKGFSKIAADTARSGKDVIHQYGQAVKQDFNINRQNFMAMTLARSTPIYGYFIAKFMETDVWKRATERLKQNISNVVGAVGNSLRGVFSKVKFSLSRKTDNEETPTQKVKKRINVPKMQRGGYVEKGGLARVHAAEVVVPIEKILSRIDESISISQEVANASRRYQLQSLAKIGTFVKDQQQYQKSGIFKGFFQALKAVQTRYEEPASTRILRAVLAIQDSIGATVGTWQQIWQKMLIEHPTLRNMIFFMRGLYHTLASPFKFVYGIFKTRGGYKGHLSSAKNPMQAAAENIGLVYTGAMWRLDNVVAYTRATAEAVRDISSALTGKKYGELEGVSKSGWSFFGIARKMVNFLVKTEFKGISLITKGLSKSIKLLTGETELTKKVYSLGEGIDKLGNTLTRDLKIEDFNIFRKKEASITDIALEEKKTLREERHQLLSDVQKIREIQEKISTTPEYNDVAIAVGENISPIIEHTKETNEKLDNVIQLSEKRQHHIKQAQKKNEKLSITNITLLEKIRNFSKDTFDKIKKLLAIITKMDRREHRRTITGFFTQGAQSISGIVSSVLGGILPFITGFGSGFLISTLKKAFGVAAGGTIIGAFAARIIGIIKKVFIKFPASFLKKLAPVLSRLKGLSFLLGAGGPLGLKIAAIAAAVTGTAWLAKAINKWEEDSETIKSIRTWVSKKPVDTLEGLVSSSNLNTSAAKIGGATEEDLNKLSLVSKGMLSNRKLLEKDVGIHGVWRLHKIFEGQANFMYKSYSDYLKYDPAHIEEIRNKWLKEGGYHRGKKLLENPEQYGMKREETFLKYLQKHGSPLSDSLKEKGKILGTISDTTVDKKKGKILGTISDTTFDKDKIKVLEKNAKLYQKSIQTNQEVLERAMKGVETQIEGYQKGISLAGTTVVDQGSNFIHRIVNKIKLIVAPSELQKNAKFYQESIKKNQEVLEKAIRDAESHNTPYHKIMHENFYETDSLIKKGLNFLYGLVDRIKLIVTPSELEKNAKLYQQSINKNKEVLEQGIKDHEDNILIRKSEMVIQQVKNQLQPTKVLQNELERNAKLYQKSTEGHGAQIVNAINNQTTVITNSSSTVSNVSSGGPRGAMNRVIDNYTHLTIRGEIDGD